MASNGGIRELAYGLEIVDDQINPENAVYILTSVGQSGSVTIVIILMAVDGGITGCPSVIKDIPHGEVKEGDVPDVLREGLREIHRHFILNCSFLNDSHIEEIIKKWKVINDVEENQTYNFSVTLEGKGPTEEWALKDAVEQFHKNPGNYTYTARMIRKPKT